MYNSNNFAQNEQLKCSAFSLSYLLLRAVQCSPGRQNWLKVDEKLLTFKDNNHFCLALSDCEYRELVELKKYVIDK